MNSKKQFKNTKTKIKIKIILMESKALAEKFDQTRSMKTVEEIDSKYEQLLGMGVHPDFAHRLSEMFQDIRATVAEIEEAGNEITAANDEIVDSEKHIRMRSISSLDEWREVQAANDEDFFQWEKSA